MQIVFQKTSKTLENLIFVSTKNQLIQILIEISRIMKMNLIFHRTTHFIKFDVNFLNDYDRQMIKRIWKIDQNKICYVWHYYVQNNIEKILIKLRQKIKIEIVSKTYKLLNFDYDVDENEKKHTNVV